MSKMKKMNFQSFLALNSEFITLIETKDHREKTLSKSVFIS